MEQRLAVNGQKYMLLTIKFNAPFATKYLRFCIWDEMKLVGMKNLSDNVKVTYCYEGAFPVLKSIIPSEGHDECYQCRAFHEPHDAQMMTCNFCRSIPHDEHKERLYTKLKLVEKSVRSYKYSKGLVLKFVMHNEFCYYTTIYENHPLFDKYNNLDTMKLYNVIAWTTPKYAGIMDLICVF